MAFRSRDSVHYFQQELLVEENIEARGALRFLYGSRLGSACRAFVMKRFISKMYGAYNDSALSRSKIVPFIKKHAIDASEFALPVDRFSSFNDFFSRHLTSGARPIDIHSSVLASPADAKVLAYQNIDESFSAYVKGNVLSLEKMLGDSKLASMYCAGSALFFRLAPADYHRFHFPFDGTPALSKRIAGLLESVNPIAYRAGVQPLAQNERRVITMQTSKGVITLVIVGALFVGKIVETYTPDTFCKKGDEVGYFKFGASLVALLVPKGSFCIDEFLLKNTEQGFETVMKLGQRVGSF
jgi:phosphatidylserine decarboxylase